jgi:hypothetical protein
MCTRADLPVSSVRWAPQISVAAVAVALAIAVVGLVLLVWGWSTSVPPGSFGIRGFSGLWAVGFDSVAALLTWRSPAIRLAGS